MAFMLVVSLYTGFDIASQLAGLQADLEGNLASWAAEGHARRRRRAS